MEVQLISLLGIIMSFDSKKSGLLGKLNTMQKDKNRLLQNRSARARLHNQERDRENGVEQESQNRIGNGAQKPKVLLYGIVRLFQGTMKSILAPYCEIIEFSEAEKATDYIFENHIPIAILDMDPPNDWKMCHDLFTTGKTMYPDMEYIVFHKEKSVADEIAVLEAQGAKIMNKPIDQMALVQAIKKIVSKNET